jgi:hypothetical protein
MLFNSPACRCRRWTSCDLNSWSSSSEDDSEADADDAPVWKSESSLSAIDPASDGAPCCTAAASGSAGVIAVCHTPCVHVCCGTTACKLQV